MYNATVLINDNLLYWIGLNVLIGLIHLGRLMKKLRIMKYFYLNKIFLEIVIVPEFYILLSYLKCCVLLGAKELRMFHYVLGVGQ